MIEREIEQLDGARAGAAYSPCEAHRYLMWRHWQDDAPPLGFVMLNPSTATELVLDPTLKRCQARALRMGFGGFIVANLFAFRATDPNDMKAQAEPIGAENDAAIALVLERCPIVIAGWGKHGRHLGRDAAVLALAAGLGKPLQALKLNGDGTPAHPLYLADALAPFPLVA